MLILNPPWSLSTGNCEKHIVSFYLILYGTCKKRSRKKQQHILQTGLKKTRCGTEVRHLWGRILPRRLVWQWQIVLTWTGCFCFRILEEKVAQIFVNDSLSAGCPVKPKWFFLKLEKSTRILWLLPIRLFIFSDSYHAPGIRSFSLPTKETFHSLDLIGENKAQQKFPPLSTFQEQVPLDSLEHAYHNLK